MVKRLAMLFAALMVLGFVVAGCGDDDDDGGDSGSSDTPAQTESKDTGGSSGGGNGAAAEAAREGCEAGIKNNAADRRLQAGRAGQGVREGRGRRRLGRPGGVQEGLHQLLQQAGRGRCPEQARECVAALSRTA